MWNAQNKPHFCSNLKKIPLQLQIGCKLFGMAQMGLFLVLKFNIPTNAVLQDVLWIVIAENS